MVDLCRGPHVPNTSVLKAQAVTNASRAFWRGDTSKDGLQRVYGITYPDKKQLAAYQRRIEEAKKRDHRLVGTQQDLFFFHQLSPGSCFFMPHGTRIYNELVSFIRVRSYLLFLGFFVFGLFFLVLSCVLRWETPSSPLF